jgi:hypothetical protein
MNNPNEEFDLFATEVEDNLQETLAKGSYKWTNKYTAVLAGLVVVTASVSGGIWYGNKHASSSANNALAGFASRIRSAAAGDAFTGAAGATGTGTGASAFAGAGAAAGASGFAGGGFGGGSRVSGTVSKVNGNTVTITLDAPPATPIAAGDSVSVRDTGAAGAATGGAPAGAAAGGTTTTGTKRTRGTAAAGGTSTTGGTGTTSGTTTKPTIGGGGQGAGGQGGGGGGGRFNNPAFIDCLAKNGVTFTPGTRPDRTDPKVAAALQACFSTLGGAPGGGGGGNGGGRNGGGARPAPSASATP